MSNKKYDELYGVKPVGFDFAEGMTKTGDPQECAHCKFQTKFYDTNLHVFICSDVCRGDYLSTYARTHLTGYFKNYRVIYKNKTYDLLDNVRVWFAGRYLYYQLLNIPEKPKQRIDTYDIGDIQFEEQYEPETPEV